MRTTNLKRADEHLGSAISPNPSDSAAPPLAFSFDADGSDSPVHVLQARLEHAVLASFSVKEQVKPTARYPARALIIVGASLAGWALLMANVVLKVY